MTEELVGLITTMAKYILENPESDEEHESHRRDDLVKPSAAYRAASNVRAFVEF